MSRCSDNWVRRNLEASRRATKSSRALCSIVSPARTFTRQPLIGVAGQVQVEGKGEHAMVHLIAKRLFDHSELLGSLFTTSRNFH